MAPPRKPPLEVKDLQGFRYLRHFAELWQPLRACGVDKAGNRTFYFDQYLSLLLLYFFTPTLTSLRGLQQATTLDKVQKALGLPKAPGLGTLSAAARDFDPDLLRPLLAELAWLAPTRLPACVCRLMSPGSTGWPPIPSQPKPKRRAGCTRRNCARRPISDWESWARPRRWARLAGWRPRRAPGPWSLPPSTSTGCRIRPVTSATAGSSRSRRRLRPMA